MKKRIIVLTALLLAVLTATAWAADFRPAGISAHHNGGTANIRANSKDISLSFSNGMADCSALVRGYSASDDVEATLTLYLGNNFIDSWSASGKFYTSVSGSCAVKSGRTYRLVLTWSINGVAQPQLTTTKTCP
ncbi:MAG: hypothetical protein IJU78_09725 [Clostridia bacterium]|nr:hypothetical protein [Clostridia bacterium]